MNFFLQNRNTLTNIGNKLMVVRGEKWREGIYIGSWDQHKAIFKMDYQEGPTA